MCDPMVNVTLSVTENLKKKMELFPEMNWSEVARQAIQQRVQELLLVRTITAKSKLTERDVEEIGNKIKKAIADRHK